MAVHNVYACNNCGHEVRTNGCWEFYRDASGQRQIYGHPIAKSRGARENGVKGFSENLYCHQCDEVMDVIVYEFETPMDDSRAWQEFVKPDYRKSFVFWFAAKSSGFRGIIQWLCKMPTNSFKANYWYSKHSEPPCPVCGGQLRMSLRELGCPRCKEGIFNSIFQGQS